MAISCFVMFLLLLLFHEAWLVILRRYLFVMGSLYGMRAACLLVTQLPMGNFLLSSQISRVCEQFREMPTASGGSDRRSHRRESL